jgi:hypothetical protein
MHTEELSFKISLSGTYHDKMPAYSILLDDTLIKQATITQPTDVIEVIEFTAPISEGSHELKIRLENKDSSDTIVRKERDDSTEYEIIKDMLLNIVGIEVDEISLGQLIWDSEYILDKPILIDDVLVEKIDKCVNFGHNGTYVLHFTSPFYLWLLEKI